MKTTRKWTKQMLKSKKIFQLKHSRRKNIFFLLLTKKIAQKFGILSATLSSPNIKKKNEKNYRHYDAHKPCPLCLSL